MAFALDFDELQRGIQRWVVAGTGLPSGQVYWADGKPRPKQLPFVSMTIPVLRVIGNDWTQGARNPLVLPDDIVEGVSGVNLTLPTHQFLTGDGPVVFATSGFLPPPLEPGEGYWLVKTGPSTAAVATSFRNAMAGTVLSLGDGGGTHIISTTPRSLRAGEEMNYLTLGLRRFKLELECYATPAAGNAHAMAILHQLMTAGNAPSIVRHVNDVGLAVTDIEEVQTTPQIVNTAVFEPRATLNVYLYATSKFVETGTIIEAVRVTRELDGATDLIGPA